MTVTNTSTLTIFSTPLSVPVAPAETNANSVDATSPGGLQLGGISTAYSTTNFELSPQNIVLTGEGNRLNVGGGAANVAVLGGGQIIESTQFLGADSAKFLSINLGFDNPDGFKAANPSATIDLSESVSGNFVGEIVTIADAAGGMTLPNTNFYIHAGTGSDTIIGSFLNDFLRGGAGDDTIASYAGNDIVRGGSGSDFIQLGADGSFSDTLYYTSDQVVTGDIDTLDQWQSGTDRIVFDNTIDSTVVFSDGDDFSGYKTITFTSGGQSTQLNVINGSTIFKTDIFFLA
ncbi:MAG: calcium-binding protein [Cyanobacteriota bacterium]